MNRVLKAKIIERFGSQFEFALTARVSESLVSKVVRGRQVLSQEERRRWAELLNSEPGKLFQVK